jgi:hypothetical protein
MRFRHQQRGGFEVSLALARFKIAYLDRHFPDELRPLQTQYRSQLPIAISEIVRGGGAAEYAKRLECSGNQSAACGVSLSSA